MQKTVYVSMFFMLLYAIAYIALNKWLDVDFWKIIAIALTFIVLTTIRDLVVKDVYEYEKIKAIGK